MENREADDEKSLGLGSKFPKVRDVIAAVCDGTLNVKRYRYFFVVPNIFDTNNGTFSGSFFFENNLFITLQSLWPLLIEVLLVYIAPENKGIRDNIAFI